MGQALEILGVPYHIEEECALSYDRAALQPIFPGTYALALALKTLSSMPDSPKVWSIAHQFEQSYYWEGGKNDFHAGSADLVLPCRAPGYCSAVALATDQSCVRALLGMLSSSLWTRPLSCHARVQP